MLNLGKAVLPPGAESFQNFFFRGILLRFIKSFVLDFFGKKILEDKITIEGVGIFVFLSVTQLFHQFGGGIAQVQWYRKVTG